jgi:hypothetical protein
MLFLIWQLASDKVAIIDNDQWSVQYNDNCCNFLLIISIW